MYLSASRLHMGRGSMELRRADQVGIGHFGATLYHWMQPYLIPCGSIHSRCLEQTEVSAESQARGKGSDHTRPEYKRSWSFM